MREGVKLSDLYSAALAYLDERKPALREYLTKNLGFGVRAWTCPPRRFVRRRWLIDWRHGGGVAAMQTGLEFRESAFVISDKGTRELKAGMVLNLFIGFQNIPNPDGKTEEERKYVVPFSPHGERERVERGRLREEREGRREGRWDGREGEGRQKGREARPREEREGIREGRDEG